MADQKQQEEAKYYIGWSAEKGCWYYRRALFLKNVQRTLSVAKYLDSTDKKDQNLVLSELRNLGIFPEVINWL